MSSLPSGMVTFLFTDIEGSTKLAQEYPDEMPALLGRHNEILNKTIQNHDGFVFQIVGDAFCAAFHSAGEALNAALDAQHLLHKEDWMPAPLKVRMGIHTGAAQLRDVDAKEGSYSGYATMALTQRIMSAGHGGQILISQSAYVLIKDTLPEKADLRDMGERRLKNILKLERIYQLTVPDLPSEFPPLKTLESFNHNLPAQLTSFIGRQKELNEIKELVNSNRIVTLIGSGGAGKTRLSLQVGNACLGQLNNGVWFTELASVADPALVPQTLLSIFNLRGSFHRAPLDVLTDYLRSKELLLVLDNCEHLIEICAQISDTLLHTCPRLKILASSREPLGIAGEASYLVPSLATPDPNRLPPIEKLLDYESICLFVERAVTIKPDFELTKDNASFIAQACSRLDGIPLAIELAAARVKILTPQQIAARLDDRFHLLTGGSRTALPRQQTLRAAIDWSYNLLPPDEQLLFGRLSVFVGEWTLEAAESVCAGGSNTAGNSSGDDIQSEDILDLMEQLIVKSLVITEELQSEKRFHMLETIREYASEKLIEPDMFQGKHAVHFLNLAESVEPYLETSDQASWLDKLERELNNFRAALRRAGEKGQVELGLRLASALCLFWFVRGYLSEGLAQIEKFLSLSEQGVNETTRARALDRAGMLARYEGNLPRAYELIFESLSLRRELGEPRLVADSLSNLGFVVLHQGDFVKARALYSESLSINRELENQQGIADSLSHLALMAFYEGDYRSAQEMDEASLAIWRGLGDQQGIAFALYRLGNVKLHQNEYSVARQLFIESMDISNNVGFKWGIANGAEGLAAVAAGTGQATSAILLAGGASALRKEIGIPLSDMAQADFESLLVTVRKLFDREDAEAIWSKGLALNIEQIVAQAKEVI